MFEQWDGKEGSGTSVPGGWTAPIWQRQDVRHVNGPLSRSD